MKIDQPWLHHPKTRAVLDALTADHAQVFFVGGCVRNALMGEPVSDLDLTTNAEPAQVIALAERAGLKVIPTGLDHGTVTVMSGGAPYEVTTFRRDVATDGRRAVVAFATHIDEDARRRDFTMNALYAAPDGTVVDPLNGYADLMARRLRFIGTPEQRIREDYLRILRYFRFHAWYGDPDAGFDAEALAAIAATQEGLSQLSRERIGVEMMKLLAAPDPAPAMATMRQIGVLGQVLPGADDRALAPLIHLEAGQAGRAELRLACVGGADVQERLRLSNAAAHAVATLRDLAGEITGAAEISYRHGAALARDAVLLRAALLEAPLPADTEAQIARGVQAVFPIKAADLMPAYQGPALGQRLKVLEAAWIASGFTLTAQDLRTLD